MDHAWLIIALYWAFSAVVGGMPEPDASASLWYRWGFSSLHILAGNVLTAVQSRYKLPAYVPDPLPAGSSVEHKETQTTVVVTPPQQ